MDKGAERADFGNPYMSLVSLLRYWFIAGACLTSLSAHAATFVVTRNEDPLPDGCLPGDCSLREAVLAANANAGVSDDIILPNGSYGLPYGQLSVTDDLRIFGHDKNSTLIEGGGDEPVLRMTNGAGLDIRNVKIRAHGQHAIDGTDSNDTVLVDVLIPDADSNVDIQSGNHSGLFRMIDSEVHSYIDCGQARICNIIRSSLVRLQVGSVTDGILNVTLDGAIIDGDLAAIDSGLVITSQGRINIADSEIRSTNIGLQIVGKAPLYANITRLKYAGNSHPLDLAIGTDLTILDSEFRNNTYAGTTSFSAPGALHIRNADAVAVVKGSTFINNSGDGNVGGAVLVEKGASLSLTNNTFSGNSFTTHGAQINGRGAAIGFRDDPAVTTLRVIHNTIVAPTIAPVGISGTAVGGFGTGADVDVSILNSILVGTCKFDSGIAVLDVGNIESSGHSCDFTNPNQSDVSTSSLALGTLTDHGGPTLTYQPGFFSVAIDTGYSSYCVSVDQRGYPRPVGSICDVGSLEVGAERIFKNGFE